MLEFRRTSGFDKERKLQTRNSLKEARNYDDTPIVEIQQNAALNANFKFG